MKELERLRLRQTDSRFHAIDLKPTIEDKRQQLEEIKALQSELRGKELEIDEVTEKSQQLLKYLLHFLQTQKQLET